MNNEDIISALVDVGWFDGKGEAYEAKVRAGLENYDGLLGDGTVLAGILSDFNFDGEAIDGNEGDYAGIIASYARAAAPQLVIDDVSDAFDLEGNTATVRFRVAGKPYEITVPFESEWVDSKVMNLIEQAASEHCGHEFVLLPTLDQCAYVVFVKAGAFDALVERGVLLRIRDLAKRML